MRVLTYGINYLPELTGVGKYTGEMCEWLAARGHDVRVVCAVPYYPEWRVPEEYRGRIYRVEERNGVRIYRSQLLVPSNGRTVNRLLHLGSFALLSLPQLLRQWRWRPDVLIGIEPTLFCAPATLLASRLFNAPCLLHIQDLELDAMSGLGMGKAGRRGSRIERSLMKRFDLISTVSCSMVERAASRLGDGRRVVFFPNWVDLDFIRPGRSADDYRDLWGISPESKVVLYCGNMGKKQGLGMVLDTAYAMRSERNVLFVLVGAGAAEEDLRSRAKAMSLRNVRFYPLQPYERLPDLMALGDVHLVVQLRGAADAVLPSKLTTILAAGGNALITAEAGTDLGQLCEQYPGIAFRADPEDPDKFADALRNILEQVDVDDRRSNRVARAYAEEHLDKNRVLMKFEEEVSSLIGCRDRRCGN